MAKARSRQPAEGSNAEQANGTVNKMEAVRRALAHMGDEAKPQAIHEFVMDHFHLDLPKTLISTYKTSITKKAAEKSRVIRKPGNRTAAAAPAESGITVEDIRAIQEVASRIGASKVRELVDVLCP